MIILIADVSYVEKNDRASYFYDYNLADSFFPCIFPCMMSEIISQLGVRAFDGVSLFCY